MRFVGDDKPVDLPVLQASTFQAEFFSVGCPKPSSRQRWKQPAILPSLNVKAARSRRGIVPFTHLAREGRMTVTIGRRELPAALGGAAAAWRAAGGAVGAAGLAGPRLTALGRVSARLKTRLAASRAGFAPSTSSVLYYAPRSFF